MGINPLATSENVPGVQSKNIAWLKAQTEYLKAQEKFVKEVNKTKKETWEAMTESVTTLDRFAQAGGINQVFGGSIARFKKNLMLGIEGSLTGVTNAFVGVANDILEELKPAFDSIGKAVDGLVEGAKKITFISGSQEMTLWDMIMAGVGGLVTFIPTLWGVFDNFMKDLQALDAANAAARHDYLYHSDDFVQRTGGVLRPEEQTTW